LGIAVGNKNTMKNHQNHQMVQLYLSVVTSLLFLVTRDDDKRENITKVTF